MLSSLCNFQTLMFLIIFLIVINDLDEGVVIKIEKFTHDVKFVSRVAVDKNVHVWICGSVQM